jgi:hypothetical protein
MNSTDEHDLRLIVQEVERMVDSTRDRIAVLDGSFEEQSAVTVPSSRVSGELLAETVQELCQSATVINCTVSMLCDGGSDMMSPEQKDTLKNVGQCAEKLNQRLEILRQMVGVPQGLIPKKS